MGKHFNVFDFGFFCLRDDDLEHAVVELGLDLFRIDRGRQRQDPAEFAVASFDPMIGFAFVLFLFLAFARDPEVTVLQLHFDFFGLQARQIDRHLKLVLGFDEVDRWQKRSCQWAFLGDPEPIPEILHLAFHPIHKTGKSIGGRK